MKYSAVLNGFINGQEIVVTGSGTIEGGLTQGDYVLEKLPDVFDPQILEAMLITGYPNACHSFDGSHNVFKGKSYRYKRQLRFNNGGLLEMTANCVLKDDCLTSTFNVQGNLICDEPIDNAEPIIEVWQPTEQNNLSGLFRFTWKTKSGSYLSADAHSVYEPGDVSNEQPILHRYIEIVATKEGNRFSLKQNSTLFHRMNN